MTPSTSRIPLLVAGTRPPCSRGPEVAGRHQESDSWGGPAGVVAAAAVRDGQPGRVDATGGAAASPRHGTSGPGPAVRVVPDLRLLYGCSITFDLSLTSAAATRPASPANGSASKQSKDAMASELRFLVPLAGLEPATCWLGDGSA